MKRRIKQITALICATIMAVSGCLVDGVIVSRADDAKGSNPVIKYNNPGIGVNVGDTIDLTQYAVEFEDGAVTSAEKINWPVSENKQYYIVSYGSPAIPANKDDVIDLTEYMVEFAEGQPEKVSEWTNNGKVVQKLTATDTGVYQLIAKSASGSGETKEVYVVVKNADDSKYVLYRNDFTYDSEVQKDYVAKYDFVNISEKQMLTKLRTKASDMQYKMVDETISYSADESISYHDFTMERWASDGSTGIASLNAHLLLPNWLGDFGDYQIDMETRMRDDSNLLQTNGYVAIDLRAQYDYDVADATEENSTIRLSPNYVTRVYNSSKKSYAICRSTDGNACKTSSDTEFYKALNGIDAVNSSDGQSTLDVFRYFTMSTKVYGNDFSISLSQQKGDAIVTFAKVEKTLNGVPRTGRIGIWGYMCAPRVNYIEVSLVEEALTLDTYTAAGSTNMSSFTPDAKGVTALTAKNTETGVEKTIYIVAKNPEDTEYVMWENNFDTAADAPYYDMGTLNDYDGFGRLYGSGSYAVNEETGKLEISTGSSRTHLRFPSWIGEFGNYAVQMTENTLTVADASKQIGLFARGGESRNYTPNYSVLLRYKGYGSDSIAFRVRNEWLDNDDSADAKLSYKQPMVWGKVLNRETVKPENTYVHELFVQDDLVEYKVNGITRLYDVREREFKTGHVGVLIEGGITIHLDSVKVLFVPDVAVPEGPISASYSRTTSTPGFADGKVTVKLSEGNSARDILCYWGNNGKELEGYTHFGKAVVEAGATSVTVELGENIMVPQGATELLVYTENHMGRSAEYVAIPLNEGVTPLQTGEELMSFQVISDTHITTKADGYASLNFEKFLTDLTTNDPDSIGVFIGGDLVDNGSQAEYDTFYGIVESVEKETGKEIPGLHSVIGNHEFWTESTYEGTVDLFNKNTGREDEDTLYYAEEINGYHFIYLASGKLTASYKSHTNAELGEAQLAWFAKEMQTRAEDGKPIFVFLHQPLQDTVTGAGSDSVKDHEAVKEILANYPQTFFFTSHSHMNFNTPGTMVSAEDGLCNMFNTSAISYLMNTHYTDKTITSDGAEAYYVEVYKDKVLVRGKDVTTNKWMPSAQFVVSFAEETEGTFVAELNSKNVAYLDDLFDVYKFDKPTTKEKTYATLGPVKASEKDANSYQGSYTYFTAAANYGSKTKGALKPGSASGSGYTLLTYKRTRVKAFEAEYTFYAGGDNTKPVGLIFGGEKGQLPFSLDGKANDKGVGLFMDKDGSLYVYGAINPDGIEHSTTESRITISKNVTDISRMKDVVNVKISDGTDPLFENKISEIASTVTTDTPAQTVCVKVSNGYLTVYEKSNYNRIVTIPLTDEYQGGYVSLFGTTDQGGGFKNFNVKPMENWDYDTTFALKGYTVGYLDNEFDVYQYEMPTTNAKREAKLGPVEPSTDNEDKSGYSYFTNRKMTTTASGNNEYGLKTTSVPGGNGKGLAALTYTKESMKSFKAEYDFFPGKTASVYGLVMGIGSDGKFPVSFDGTNTNDKGVVVYMSKEGKLYVAGAIDTSKITCPENKTITTNVEEGFVAGTANFCVEGMTDGSLSYDTYLMTPESAYFTVCVEVEDELLTVYEKEHPEYAVSVQLARVASGSIKENYYESGYVALFANTVESGSFRGFRLTKTGNYYFRRTTLNELDQHFDSYVFEDGQEPVKGLPSAQWNKLQDAQDDGGTLGLKPSEKSNSETNKGWAMSLKNKTVKNFEASLEYYTAHVHYGIMVAPEGEMATAENGVVVTVNGKGQICVSGAIDGTTGQWSGTENGTFDKNEIISPVCASYPNPSDKSRAVLNVKVKDGILTASIDGFEGQLTVKLSSCYQGGAISMFSRGRNQGGIWSFDVNTLDAEPKAKISVPFDFSVDGELVKVKISSDAAYSKLIGGVKYDASKFEFMSAEIENSIVSMVDFSANEGTIPVNMLINNNEGTSKLVTLYFKEIVDTLDFTGFMFDDYDVVASGGISVTRVDIPMDVEHDHTEDKKIDVLDLVRGKKNSTEENKIDVTSVRKLLCGKSIYEASVSAAVVIDKDVTVKSGDSLGTKGTTTIYKDCVIDFKSIETATDVQLVGCVIFDNVTVNGVENVNLYANGYEFKVCENVSFDENKKLRRLYGGRNNEQTTTTNLTLLGGKYEYIYTGTNKSKVMGDTHITIGGNAIVDRVLGGGYQGQVLGNTYVTIQGNTEITEAYGGGYQNATVEGNCYVSFLGGNVKNLYGGGRQADVNGNTYVVVGGNANAGINVADHDNLTNLIYGGGDGSANTAIVKGNTYVTVQDSARAHVVYGGGYGSMSTVEGICNVEINGGYVMGYYGGSRNKGDVFGTNVIMTAGKTEQIFGGCDRYSMTGDVNVVVSGGEVQRRIYGGCYNDFDSDNEKWLTNYGVNGQVTVIIGEEANLSFDLKTALSGMFKADNSLMAVSRYSGEIEGETGILIFLDSSYADNSGKIGYHSDVGFANKFTTRYYDYLVKATAGGTVTMDGNALYIVPNEGKSVTVSDGSSSVYTANEAGKCALPALEDNAQKILNVNFQ